MQVDVFATERDRLVALAYRITGSRVDAEDVVQETWVRATRAAAAGEVIERPAAWLTTVTSRLALDRLRAARRERERYVGPWLAEPVSTEPGPDELVAQAATLTLGFLSVLERLDPVERVVFVLADVFGVPFAEIAATVGRSEVACRKVASRARRRVQEGAPRFAATDDDAWAVAAAFAEATTNGDLDAMLSLLAPGAVATSDGGAAVRAARRPVVGAERVARLLVGIARRTEGAAIEPRLVNAQPGVVLRLGGAVVGVVVLSIVDRQVDRVAIVVNPDKLGAIDAPPLSARIGGARPNRARHRPPFGLGAAPGRVGEGR